MDTKFCSKCKEEKPLEEFYRDKSRKDGKTFYCKDCLGLYLKNNKEKIRETARKYRELNKEAISKKSKRYRASEKGLAARVIYLEKTKRKRSERDKRYYKINKKNIFITKSKYVKKRNAFDHCFKLKSNLGSRLRAALRQNNKAGSAVSDLGCSVEKLKEHLESKFNSQMTWSNWGKVWQLDHIYPLSAANLEDRTQFLAVNNWRNLQPLAAEENLLKSDKVTPAAQKLFDSLCGEFA